MTEKFVKDRGRGKMDLYEIGQASVRKGKDRSGDGDISLRRGLSHGPVQPRLLERAADHLAIQPVRASTILLDARYARMHLDKAFDLGGVAIAAGALDLIFRKLGDL